MSININPLQKDQGRHNARRFDKLKALSLSKGGRREHHPYGLDIPLRNP